MLENEITENKALSIARVTSSPFRILNLYAGIGGNRKLWNDDNFEITAVEYNEEIAMIYKDLYPNDTVIVADAHEYLLKNYMNFDFIWTSPPCPSHSRVRFSQKNRENCDAVYPDFKLYEEVVLLDNYFEGKYVVENVIPFYEPLIPSKKRGRHLYWTNFNLPNDIGERSEGNGIISKAKNEVDVLCKFHDYDFYKYKGEQRRDKIARNLVDYEAGKTILQCAFNLKQKKSTQALLFNE